jgi:type II secretory pathway pseudopilin PulG
MRNPRFGEIDNGAERSALTLIEVLVVVTIVTLLVVLVAPGLQRAREMARNHACQENLRKFGVSFLAFADVNRGRFSTGGYDYLRDGDVTK